MKLRCIRYYRARSVVYNPGDELEVSAAEAAYLFADAPGCFEEIKEQPGPTTDRGTGAPPSHKKIEPQRRKRR